MRRPRPVPAARIDETVTGSAPRGFGGSKKSTGPSSNLAGMGWGANREHGWDEAVSELITSAQSLRAELLRVAAEASPLCDIPARRAAQAAAKIFWDCAARLPCTRGRRRTRKLVRLWENAAAMTHFHHRAVFADAELLGFELLTGLLEHGVPRGQRWQKLRDADTHAGQLIGRELTASGEMAAILRAAHAASANQESGNDIALAAAVKAFAEPGPEEPLASEAPSRPRRRGDPRDRGPIADQAELAYRMRVELEEIRLETILASTAATREAGRRYTPWLEQALQRLTAPLPVAELELIATDWRHRRDPYRPKPGVG